MKKEDERSGKMFEEGDIVYNRFVNEFCRIKKVGGEMIKQESLRNGLEIESSKKHLAKVE